MELAMDITTDDDWCTDSLYVALFNQKLFHEFTANSKVTFRQTLAVVKLVKPGVHVCFTIHIFYFFNYKLFASSE